MNTENAHAEIKLEKRAYWANHIKQWQASGDTQSNYCRHHQLKLHQLVYWKQVFSNNPDKNKNKNKNKPNNTSGFVTVNVTPAVTNATTSDLTLQLPNGLRIDGIRANNLDLIQKILRWHA